MMLHHWIPGPLLSASGQKFPAVIIGMVLLAVTSLAAAQAQELAGEASEIESPAHPFYCETWEALIDERLASEEPLERSLGEIYGNEEFSWCQTQRMRVREERESRWDFNLPGLGTLAEIMRLLAIAGMVALLIWAMWRWRQQIGALVGTAGKRNRKPIEGAWQEQVPAAVELPSDVCAEAREQWNLGHRRAAVSLLYRGSLARLLGHVRSAESRTEREVQRLLRSQGLEPATLTYMNDLILCWQRTAWAHQPPGSEEFERLLAQWPHHCQTSPKQGITP